MSPLFPMLALQRFPVNQHRRSIGTTVPLVAEISPPLHPIFRLFHFFSQAHFTPDSATSSQGLWTLHPCASAKPSTVSFPPLLMSMPRRHACTNYWSKLRMLYLCMLCRKLRHCFFHFCIVTDAKTSVKISFSTLYI